MKTNRKSENLMFARWLKFSIYGLLYVHTYNKRVMLEIGHLLHSKKNLIRVQVVFQIEMNVHWKLSV